MYARPLLPLHHQANESGVKQGRDAVKPRPLLRPQPAPQPKAATESRRGTSDPGRNSQEQGAKIQEAAAY